MTDRLKEGKILTLLVDAKKTWTRKWREGKMMIVFFYVLGLALKGS